MHASKTSYTPYHCATCADEARSALVVALIGDDMARVDIDGDLIECDISLVDAIAVGDSVLVHGGVAIAHDAGDGTDRPACTPDRHSAESRK
ncbi:MAG TPA: HypC/HybG/HupF family hydrogenase formation chaperone [Roseiflexaceae bacterium]|nr:HypC/HybG/HupF family hydrogenase formation chaperone [Roseiflexaceae bacterium]HMP41316.1 HypC/HybG/HupF family hydrogenase formation chaperone [Roseiflexaceae bacterium]